MFILKLTTCLAVAAFGSGRTSNISPGGRIIGGYPAKEGEFPYQVSLSDSTGNECGGSILNERFILTAGHCIGTETLTWNVIAGVTNLTEEGQVRTISALHPHPNYGRDSNSYDIGVIELNESLVFNENVQPVKLISPGAEIGDGTLVTVTGFGADESGYQSDILLQVQVPIISPYTCSDWYVGGIPDDQFCAGYEEGGKDSCGGDSGSPVTLDGYQLGLVSWGIGCAEPKHPGVYTKVSIYLDFINGIIKPQV